MSEATRHAVLTGDLVASRGAHPDAVERAMSVLRATAGQFEQTWQQDLRFTRFRGDGWQVLVDRPGLILDATLALFAGLCAADLGIETRAAAGIGRVDSRGTSDLSDATGTAFFTSGDGLERIGKRKRISLEGDGVTLWQKAIFDLTDQLVLAWSGPQAEAAAMALDPAGLTQEDMAQRLGITRQAVQSRLAGSHVAALGTALTAFRGHDFEGSD